MMNNKTNKLKIKVFKETSEFQHIIYSRKKLI